MKRDWSGKPRRGAVASARLCASLVALIALCLPVGPARAVIYLNPPAGTLSLLVGPVSDPVGLAAAVSFVLVLGQVGNGTPVVGTPVVHIEMAGLRSGPGASFNAELRASVPAFIVSGPNQIPMSDISWTSAAIGTGGSVSTIADGSFIAGGGSQTIGSLTVSSANVRTLGGDLTFSFANTVAYPAGNYGPATVTYTAHWL